MNEERIKVVKLVKRFPNASGVEDISFSVRAGECFVVLGPNGAGKTTLLESVAGLAAIDSGEISILGEDPSSPRVKERIGFHFQGSSFDRAFKVREILAYFQSFYAARAAAPEIVEVLGLGNRLEASFGSLSTGWKQRVHLAVALIHNPEVLFLDELTLGLDVESRRRIHAFIKILQSRGRAILLATNDMHEAENLATRMMLLRDGRCAVAGTLGEITAGFAAGYVSEYAGNGEAGTGRPKTLEDIYLFYAGK